MNGLILIGIGILIAVSPLGEISAIKIFVRAVTGG